MDLSMMGGQSSYDDAIGMLSEIGKPLRLKKMCDVIAIY